MLSFLCSSFPFTCVCNSAFYVSLCVCMYAYKRIFVVHLYVIVVVSCRMFVFVLNLYTYDNVGCLCVCAFVYIVVVYIQRILRKFKQNTRKNTTFVKNKISYTQNNRAVEQ